MSSLWLFKKPSLLNYKPFLVYFTISSGRNYSLKNLSQKYNTERQKRSKASFLRKRVLVS